MKDVAFCRLQITDDQLPRLLNILLTEILRRAPDRNRNIKNSSRFPDSHSIYLSFASDTKINSLPGVKLSTWESTKTFSSLNSAIL